MLFSKSSHLSINSLLVASSIASIAAFVASSAPFARSLSVPSHPSHPSSFQRAPISTFINVSSPHLSQLSSPHLSFFMGRLDMPDGSKRRTTAARVKSNRSLRVTDTWTPGASSSRASSRATTASARKASFKKVKKSAVVHAKAKEDASAAQAIADDILNSVQAGDDEETPTTKKKGEPPRVKRFARVKQLTEFHDHRETILWEFLRDEAPIDAIIRTSNDLVCESCGGSNEGENEESCDDTLYRCKDCYGGEIYCAGCMSFKHKRAPFHMIEKWNGDHFEHTSLRDIGLQLHLGHGGDDCPNPQSAPSAFVIGHTNGFHKVKFFFCGCAGSSERWVQLLRAKMWPATYQRVQTAFTIQLLDLFQRLNLHGKLTMYDFYNTLCGFQDNSGVTKQKSRYDELHLASRMFRNIKLLKRMGRGHDPLGVAATQPGSLAVECPACPQPYKNLPRDWLSAPEERRWLYKLDVSVDADFRVKMKNRKLDDVPLLGDWAYHVNQAGFEEHVANQKGEEYVNFCDSNLHAVDHANKRNRSYKYMGVGAAKCSRHTFVRPNGVGDLPRGESYACMDYIVFSSIRGTAVYMISFCYDIGCQWIINLRKRMQDLPDDISMSELVKIIKIAIPDFHLCGHGAKCQSAFSLMRIRNTGRHCGEGIETEWASINGVVASTREMTPSARLEVLNDHWGFWNWNKVIKMGDFLMARLKLAVTTRNRQSAVFVKFSSNIPEAKMEEWLKIIDEWDNAILRWENSGHNHKVFPTAFNVTDPYQHLEKVVNLTEVAERMAAEEQKSSADAKTNAMRAMTPSRWLSMGMDLEERQRAILTFIKTSTDKNKKLSRTDEGVLVTKRKDLACRISAWEDHLSTYLPVADRMEDSSNIELSDEAASTAADEEAPPAAELTILRLPSNLPSDLWTECSDLLHKELLLRQAEAADSISNICRQLRHRQYLQGFKGAHVQGTGQGANTRMQNMIAQYSARIDQYSRRYRAARKVIERLSPSADCLKTFLELRQTDLRFPSARRREEDALMEDDVTGSVMVGQSANVSARRDRAVRDQRNMKGQSKEEIPWIWTVGLITDEEETGEGEAWTDMRVEWCRSKSRVERWSEEVELLAEEMRRVVQYFQWKTQWWLQQIPNRDGPKTSERFLALRAYALEQCAMWHRMAQRCVNLWDPLLRKEGLVPQWPSCLEPRSMETSEQDIPADEDLAKDGVDLEMAGEDVVTACDAAASFSV